jgi:hypothetical protein
VLDRVVETRLVERPTRGVWQTPPQVANGQAKHGFQGGVKWLAWAGDVKRSARGRQTCPVASCLPRVWPTPLRWPMVRRGRWEVRGPTQE